MGEGMGGERSGKLIRGDFTWAKPLKDHEDGLGETVKGRREEGHSRQRQGPRPISGEGNQHSSLRALLGPGICTEKAELYGELSRDQISRPYELSRRVWTSLI